MTNDIPMKWPAALESESITTFSRRTVLAVLGGTALGGSALSALPRVADARPTAETELQKLLASDGDSGDGFGISVASDGDTALVGAYADNNPNGMDAGAAYVFEFDFEFGGGTWTETQKLTASDDGTADGFGLSLALDRDSDTALIGTYRDNNTNGENAGAVYVFIRRDGTWIESQKLLASDGAADDEFGISVAIDGDTALVGASRDDNPNGAGAGAAYVFEFDGSAWSETVKLLSSDGTDGDRFGAAVALDGSTAVVGAPFDDHTSIKNAGAAYVFSRTDDTQTAWAETQKLTASDPGARSGFFPAFGETVALDGPTVLVGAPFEDNADGTITGAAYVFAFDGTTWSEPAKLTPSDGAAFESFGKAVALDGTTALVGARFAGPEPNKPGAAYVFEFDGTDWSETRKLLASDGGDLDNFGYAVALDRDTIIVGARLAENADGATTGAAYVFGALPPLRIPFEILIGIRQETLIPDSFPVAGLLLEFIVSDSSDSDDQFELYEWDFDGDGQFEVQRQQPTATHTFTDPGERTIALRLTDDDGATATVEQSLVIYRRLDTDIKSDHSKTDAPAPINPKSRGVTPVTIPATQDFDPAVVDMDSLEFGPPEVVAPESDSHGARVAHGHVRDGRRDTAGDLVVHFRTHEAGFGAGDEIGVVVGETDTGVPVVGADEVRIVGAGRGGSENRNSCPRRKTP